MVSSPWFRRVAFLIGLTVSGLGVAAAEDDDDAPAPAAAAEPAAADDDRPAPAPAHDRRDDDDRAPNSDEAPSPAVPAAADDSPTAHAGDDRDDAPAAKAGNDADDAPAAKLAGVDVDDDAPVAAAAAANDDRDDDAGAAIHDDAEADAAAALAADVDVNAADADGDGVPDAQDDGDIDNDGVEDRLQSDPPTDFFDADGDGKLEPDEAAGRQAFADFYDDIPNEITDDALDARPEDAEMVASISVEDFRKGVAIAKNVVLGKLAAKAERKAEARMATFSWIVFGVSCVGLLLLATPLVLRKKYPNQGAVLAKYSALAAVTFFVTVNLFGGVLYGMRTVQGSLSRLTNPSIAIANGTFDTLYDNAEDYVVTGKELFLPTLEQMRHHPDEQPAVMLLQNGMKIVEDAKVFMTMAKAFKKLDFAFSMLPIILTIVTLLLFVIAIRPTLVEIVKLPAQAAQGNTSAGRDVIRNSLRRVRGEMLATLCTVGVLTVLTIVSAAILGRVVQPALDTLLRYFAGAVSYLQFVDGASSTLVFLSLVAVMVFLVLNLAALILSMSFFLGKAQKIFQARFNDQTPIKTHARFFQWGVPAVLLVQLFPLLFAHLSDKLLGAINESLMEGVKDAESIPWAKLMLAGPVVLVLAFVALFWAARGLKAIRFLQKYLVKPRATTAPAPTPPQPEPPARRAPSVHDFTTAQASYPLPHVPGLDGASPPSSPASFAPRVVTDASNTTPVPRKMRTPSAPAPALMQPVRVTPAAPAAALVLPPPPTLPAEPLAMWSAVDLARAPTEPELRPLVPKDPMAPSNASSSTSSGNSGGHTVLAPVPPMPAVRGSLSPLAPFTSSYDDVDDDDDDFISDTEVWNDTPWKLDPSELAEPAQATSAPEPAPAPSPVATAKPKSPHNLVLRHPVVADMPGTSGSSAVFTSAVPVTPAVRVTPAAPITSAAPPVVSAAPPPPSQRISTTLTAPSTPVTSDTPPPPPSPRISTTLSAPSAPLPAAPAARPSGTQPIVPPPAAAAAMRAASSRVATLHPRPRPASPPPGVPSIPANAYASVQDLVGAARAAQFSVVELAATPTPPAEAAPRLQTRPRTDTIPPAIPEPTAHRLGSGVHSLVLRGPAIPITPPSRMPSATEAPPITNPTPPVLPAVGAAPIAPAPRIPSGPAPTKLGR